tara:strand:+ start:4452 stop:5675 length:1224 start_codon:yes stop_codon:yes gene_type:complete
MIKPLPLATALLLPLTLPTSIANAGGLWLNEFGDFSAGRASAGAAAGTDEAATIIHNPASATRVRGSQLFASAGLFIPRVEFDIEESSPLLGSDNGDEAGLAAPASSAAYVHDTGSDTWAAGIYLAGMAGAGLEYNRNWVGRYQITETELLVLALAPTLAWQITDALSVGVAAQIHYSTLDMKLRIPTSAVTGREDGTVGLDGDDSGIAYMLGLTWELSSATRMGLTYQSEIEINFGGQLKFNPAGLQAQSDTELTMAQTVRASIHHAVNDRLALDLTLGWDNWAALDNVFVSVDAVGGSGLEKNWDDTYHYALGFSYALTPDWDITAGIAYDTNPVDARDRTADLPVDRQVRYNAGLRKTLSDRLTIGGYVNYTDLGRARISTDFLRGQYSSNEVYTLSAYLNWAL